MKKLLAFVLALLMALSLAACGAGEKETDGDAATPPATDGSDYLTDDAEKEDSEAVTPPETDGSSAVIGENDKSDDVGADESQDETENTDNGTPVVFIGDCLYLDILGDEYGDSDVFVDSAVIVIDSVEELTPYLETVSHCIDSNIKYINNLDSDRITLQMLDATMRFKKAENFFKKECNSGFFAEYKLLLVKFLTSANDWLLSDVRLEKNGEKSFLRLDIATFERFGSDVDVYKTCWVAVPNNLNIDYENDVKLNRIGGIDTYDDPLPSEYWGGYELQNYGLSRWRWVFNKKTE